MAQHLPGAVGNFGGSNQIRREGAEGVRTPERTRETQESKEAESKDRLPAGQDRAQETPETQTQRRVIRKKVRRRRVDAGQTNQTWGGAKTEGNAKTQKGQRAGQAAHTGPGQHMLRSQMNGSSSLVRASVLYQNNNANAANDANGTNNQARVRQDMLRGLSNYISNDYQMMRANPDDKAFTYRTAEARVLNSTINQMVASAARPSSNSKSNEGTSTQTDENRLTPEAFGRQKGLLRRLSAMSEPNQPLPEGLPPDYRPFEGVA